MRLSITIILCIVGSTFLSAQWEQMNDTPFRRHHGIAFSIGEYAYMLTGGTSNVIPATKTFHRYDPNTDTWEPMPDYPGPNRGYSIGAVWEDKLYFGFGVTTGFNDLNDLWVFDPADDSFTQLPDCPCAGRAHPAFVAMNNKIYMGMGDDAFGNKNDWWAYDIPTQTWEQKANIPGVRHHPYQFVIGEDIYVGSGHRADWHHYDSATDSWSEIADLDDRVAGTQFSHNGKGYILSGVTNFHQMMQTGEFLEYDPLTDIWTILEPHPGNSRWAPGSFIMDNHVYLVAGLTNIGADEVKVWRYKLEETPPSNTHDVVNETFLQVYPNPFENSISIDLTSDLFNNKELTVSVYNSFGQLVYEDKKIEDSLDLSFLNSGMYTLEIRSKKNVIKKQLLKI